MRTLTLLITTTLLACTSPNSVGVRGVEFGITDGKIGIVIDPCAIGGTEHLAVIGAVICPKAAEPESEEI